MNVKFDLTKGAANVLRKANRHEVKLYDEAI